ncbi:hypothetical protein K438DRAFT_2018410 [Mycena galopus ATCC 62051]|nr:hypothetical protein K438DRAFT_2018410 [Mycena galopus ATCC 62051]
MFKLLLALLTLAAYSRSLPIVSQNAMHGRSGIVAEPTSDAFDLHAQIFAARPEPIVEGGISSAQPGPVTETRVFA